MVHGTCRGISGARNEALYRRRVVAKGVGKAEYLMPEMVLQEVLATYDLITR